MAKNGGAKMTGPMYTPPGEGSLGPTKVGGPTGAKSPSDPLGLTHGIFSGGPGASQERSQEHSKS